MPNFHSSDDIQDFFDCEEFLAFFNFHLPGSGGRKLDGLCKVSRPRAEARKQVDYICLTFIVDTPSHKEETEIETTLAKLTEKAFKARLTNLRTLTSVPTSGRRAENYIHQMDLIFQRGADIDAREVIPMIMFTIRNEAGLKTESPQWWDEQTLKPQPTALEKSNWGNRFKAMFKALGS